MLQNHQLMMLYIDDHVITFVSKNLILIIVENRHLILLMLLHNNIKITFFMIQFFMEVIFERVNIL